MIETYRGIVYPHQLDHMGHMNIQWYAAKFDEATWHFLSAIGITSAYIKEHHQGMAALEQKTQFKSEVNVGQLLLIRTRLLAVNEKTVRFLHIMYDAETMEEAARCELMGIHFDRRQRKSTPFPAVVREQCALLKQDS
ncbi:MAG: thioesterase family protein [Deltaproteobacteria bacterium]|nr:thioesterase family protein [Candidatus Anaeroferrophillus wilburensis]MBN2890066.1 thioesterase family protein [Deltaproteobacteria bacterium]